MTKNNGLTFDRLEIGMNVTTTNLVTEDSIQKFAEVSGDTNPVHLDAEYAANTRFKQRIAHGILTASFISAAVGTEMPGPGNIYVSQTLNFRAPVYIGDEVTTSVTITALDEKRKFAHMETVCSVGDRVVLDGVAIALVPTA